MSEENAGEVGTLIAQGLALVEEGERRGLQLRITGGVAVAVHCPSAAHRSLRREYGDIDFVTSAHDGRRLDELVLSVGYEAEKRFNSLHGKRRRIYTDPSSGRQVDIFVGDFEMCHSVPLRERLDADSPTISLADLFLTKAQIVELNEKDRLDIYAVLMDHRLGRGDDEEINVDRIAALCGADWGLWRTTMGTLAKLDAGLESDAAAQEGLRATVSPKVAELRDLLDAAPKTRRWKARARIGERRQWYQLPEDARRRAAG